MTTLQSSLDKSWGQRHWAENSRIETIPAIITGDEIHLGEYNLFKVTPVMTGHRGLYLFLTF